MQAKEEGNQVSKDSNPSLAKSWVIKQIAKCKMKSMGNFQWLWANGSIRMAGGYLPAVAYCLQYKSTPGKTWNQSQVSEDLGLW